jgi:ribonuclease P protein component
MLPAAARLRRRDEFATTVRDGRRIRRGALVLHLFTEQAASQLPGRPGPVARAGFVVSRRVGTAVTRNLVVRRLRHLVRDRLDRLPAGTMLVVRALPTAAVAGYDELGRDLDRGLDRLIGGG